MYVYIYIYPYRTWHVLQAMGPSAYFCTLRQTEQHVAPLPSKVDGERLDEEEEEDMEG
jgi:hypothetical protein